MNPLLVGKNITLRINVPKEVLIEEIKERRECIISDEGYILVDNGKHTGRAPKDRYIVINRQSIEVEWNNINQPISQTVFNKHLNAAIKYIENKDLYLNQCHAGSDAVNSLKLDVITDTAWQSLFSSYAFLNSDLEGPEDFTIISLSKMNPAKYVRGYDSEVFVGIDFEKRIVLILGTNYAGEIKKSVFSIMNYLLPARNVFPMHCSANISSRGKTSLFFGLSGTGKTTLSIVDGTKLIGDDEHAWTDKGVFNFEGASYAKIDGLTKDSNDVIWDALSKDVIIENSSMKLPVDFEDLSVSTNIRATVPITNFPELAEDLKGDHPSTIFFLSADAFGVLPPISKLTASQAMYYYMSGYTSKIPGTEVGISEPKVVFSECFAAPFIPRNAYEYAKLLRDKIQEHNIPVYLVNTGWIGNKYPEGKRIPLKYTKRMVAAAITEELLEAKYKKEKYFGLRVPEEIKGIPSEILHPERLWVDLNKYEVTAKNLVNEFHENFYKFEQVPQYDYLVKTGAPKGDQKK